MIYRILALTYYSQMRITLSIVGLALTLLACGGGSNTAATTAAAPVDTATWSTFDADSAYAHIAHQLDFGPRVPGTDAHTLCADYLTATFEAYGADTVMTQRVSVTTYDGRTIPARNILARFNTSALRRILIAAHYDTRPWADEDPDEANRNTPIPGANDGASGVGVALELARQLGLQAAPIGVDFLMVDAEDMGPRSDESESEGWCLGSAAWAAELPYRPVDRPAYGILLDMVGGDGAVFTREYFSERQAPAVVAKVWDAAAREGISRFSNTVAGAVTDDHINLSRAGIPCIDIIECANPDTGSFPPYWHTLSDDMRHISKSTLSDVGRTLMRVIYTEKPE